MTNCSRIVRKTGKRHTGSMIHLLTLCRISKIVMHKQRIQVLSFNDYSLFFLLVISIVYTDKNLSSGDLAFLFIRIWRLYDFLHKKIQAQRRRRPGCFWRVYWRTQETRFGDLRGFYSADEKVPAEEIKIEIWGRFEKRRSREANEIKGVEISKIHRAGR